MQQEMKYVYQVYLDGSISRAAEHLYITQPALSMSIQKIENELGMPLFDRSTRPLTLTLAGQIYIETVRQAMFLEKDMVRQMEDVRRLNTGSLCIGGSHYLNSYILPQVLTGFSRKYPGIQLQLVELSSAQLAQMLADRELDLTFNCDPEFLENFQRFPAFYDNILLAIPKEDPINQGLMRAALTSRDIVKKRHLKKSTPTVDLAQFKELEFLLLAPGNNLYDRGRQLFQEAGFHPKIKMEISQLATAYHLAEHGLAATFISDRLVIGERDSLCYYKLDSHLTERLFYILLPEKKYISFAVRTFIEYFKEQML